VARARWASRGNLGTYLDAIALGAAAGTTPSTGAVRSFRTSEGAQVVAALHAFLAEAGDKPAFSITTGRD
jgi:hypothetical protein